MEQASQFECQICIDERKRRHRVLPAMTADADVHLTTPASSAETSSLLKEDPPEKKDENESANNIPEHLQDSLRSRKFKDCLFITRCNEPVGANALQRAKLFAESSRLQLLWVQAEDYLEDPHFSNLSPAEKIKRKKASAKQ